MNLAKSFSIYTAASFFNKGMMAILAFFLSHYILPDENGILSLYSVFVLFVLPFVILGMPSSLVIEHAKLDEKEFRSYFSSSLALSSFSFLILLLLFLSAGQFISGVMTVPFRLLLFGMLYAYFNLFQENLLAYTRVLNKPYRFLLISAVKDLLEIALVIILVIQLGRGAEGRILSGLLTGAAVFLFGLFYFMRTGLIHSGISMKYIKEEFRFGISQVFFQFNVFILSATDKYLINYLNPDDKSGLGIYFMSSQFAFIINVLVSAFFFTYQPMLYKFLANLTPENKLKMLKIKYLFAAFLLVCTTTLCLAIPYIYQLFINEQYHPGIPYVAWLAFGYFFWGLYALLLGFLYYYKKNKVVIIFSIFSSLICIGLDYYFIRNYGIMGAAYANLMMYGILFITLFITVNRVCRLQLPWLDLRAIFGKGK
ncbi:MAG: polysaccharide biosynthesis C-terminal domain-containing protein [Chitinophagaceae bacterium]|nr:polysaccharide biosynthesis C-terminal domain-containing protein [Chitinophagaceae bacterium]